MSRHEDFLIRCTKMFFLYFNLVCLNKYLCPLLQCSGLLSFEGSGALKVCGTWAMELSRIKGCSVSVLQSWALKNHTWLLQVLVSMLSR